MPSDHTGDDATFNETISFPTDGDPKKITPIRSSLDLLLDNDAYLKNRRAESELRAAALRFSVLDLQGNVLDDTADAMGASQLLNKPNTGIVLFKAGTNDVFYVPPDDPRAFSAGGDVPSITASVRDAANNGSRIVVIGTGGNLNAYSDNEGASFSAGAAGIGGAVQYLVYSPTNALTGGGDKFICGGSGTGSIYKTTTPSVVWTSVASGFAAVQGLAVLGGSTVAKGWAVVLGTAGGQAEFSFSADNGVSWTVGARPPNSALADETGSLAGAPSVAGVGDYVYYVARSGSGARLRLARSIDATTWVETGTIERPFGAGAVFSGAPRLMIDQNMGLFVIAVPCAAAGGSIALYASRDFETWIGPAIVYAGDVGAFAVAGGRVMFTQSAGFVISAGLGAGVGV